MWSSGLVSLTTAFTATAGRLGEFLFRPSCSDVFGMCRERSFEGRLRVEATYDTKEGCNAKLEGHGFRFFAAFATAHFEHIGGCDCFDAVGRFRCDSSATRVEAGTCAPRPFVPDNRFPVVPPNTAEVMLPLTPVAVLLTVTSPVRTADEHLTVPSPFEMTLSVTFVALSLVPVARIVPVGCVTTGNAEAIEGTMPRATIRQTTSSLRIERLRFIR
jgi:hypothetical protein